MENFISSCDILDQCQCYFEQSPSMLLWSWNSRPSFAWGQGLPRGAPPQIGGYRAQPPLLRIQTGRQERSSTMSVHAKFFRHSQNFSGPRHVKQKRTADKAPGIRSLPNTLWPLPVLPSDQHQRRGAPSLGSARSSPIAWRRSFYGQKSIERLCFDIPSTIMSV